MTAKLGEGGMGQVYRATDTKLKGDEAIACLELGVTRGFRREAAIRFDSYWPRFETIRASSVFSTG